MTATATASSGTDPNRDAAERPIRSAAPSVAGCSDPVATGWWMPGTMPPKLGMDAVSEAIRLLEWPMSILDMGGKPAVGLGGSVMIGSENRPIGNRSAHPIRAYVPPLLPEQLGDAAFRSAHGLRYAYVAGAMANGITSVEMVTEMARAGMIGFFGSAGLSPDAIEKATDSLQKAIPGLPFGMNLIHSPFEPELEAATAALYIRRGVDLISASAYLDVTLPLIRYRVKGIHRDPDGRIVCPNRVVAKVSRHEVARKFFSPPPAKLLRRLVEIGDLTPEQATLAETVPVAESLTAEADSGGHTDNRPALTLLPTMLALKQELASRFRYDRPLWVGLGGGIATPEAAAAAFAMGAAYILTGSINQACTESGTSDRVRAMLAEAQQAEVAMAPAADMFEMGVRVQVLKRGTMFPQKAARLHDLYRAFPSLDALPAADRTMLEKDYFRCSLDTAWEQTRRFFQTRDPKQILRAESDPRHKMALVFRSYLGKSSQWANTGEPSRQIDYQVWCGPAIGAFNQWAAGSFLASPENRRVVTVAMNLLVGACVGTRANWARQQGVTLPDDAGRFRPMTLDAMAAQRRPTVS